MMTWNSSLFLFPSSIMMELIYLMHDHLVMFLFSVLIFSMIILFYNYFLKFFSLNFFESHQIELIWTLVPFFLLIFIVFPSLLTLYMLDSCLFCGLTLSILGHQWYWTYFYKDFFSVHSSSSSPFFDSYMLSNFSSIRLLEVDNNLVLPSSVPVRFLVSSSDVIHSWTLPSFGIKMDALPGRINQFCFSSKRSGIFFGQCSEICGINHSFMPIVVEFIPLDQFNNLFSS